MKNSSDLTQALLFRRFPGHHQMSGKHLTTFDLKKIILLLSSSALIALLTAGLFIRWTCQAMEHERLAKEKTEEHLQRMNYEIARLQQLSNLTADQNLTLVKNLHEVVESGEGDQRLFLSLIVPEALRIQISHGIPASATVAMSIYESSYGRSELAGSANNFFGIKAFASVWDGPTVYTTTRDSGKKTKAYFRQYPNIEAAVKGYATFLKSSDRYAEAFLQRDGDKFVELVLKAGYCPDSDYHKNIVAIMERHHLKKLDLPDPALNAGNAQAASSSMAETQTFSPWAKPE